MAVTLDALVDSGIMDLVRERSASEYASMPAPSMATGCIVVVEVLHDDGLKYLHSFRPDETTAWAAVGMAAYAQSCWGAEHYDD
jgi:hypothetical protein